MPQDQPPRVDPWPPYKHLCTLSVCVGVWVCVKERMEKRKERGKERKKERDEFTFHCPLPTLP